MANRYSDSDSYPSDSRPHFEDRSSGRYSRNYGQNDRNRYDDNRDYGDRSRYGGGDRSGGRYGSSAPYDNGGRYSNPGYYGGGRYDSGSRYGNNGKYSRYGNTGRYNDRPNRFSGERYYSNRPNGEYQGRTRRPSTPYNKDFETIDPENCEQVEGVLDIIKDKGFGFLRKKERDYARDDQSDPYVSIPIIKKMNLRKGVLIRGKAQPQDQNNPRLIYIDEIDGYTPEEYAKIKPFDEMTPINPETWLKLATGPEPISTRVIDLLAPLGKGQRALIVAPPRTGKTVLLQQICQAITQNYPDIKVFVLLVDERPEEVTDFRRALKGAEVVASSLDCDVANHVTIADIVIERCKRLAEEGKDVFLLLDSITRLARASNKVNGIGGRTMTGGIDIKAMDFPKKLFSSARLGEEGGSLTIVGTALVDTGSRMDELIFQEFKGTGNMELVLDRHLSDRRIWPALDVSKSGTRREEILFPPNTLKAVNMIRRVLIPMNPIEAMEKLVKELSKYDTNEEFFKRFVRHE